MQVFKGVGIALLGWLAMASLAFGQGLSTSLQATVTDPSGSAIAGASVVLANPDAKFERDVADDPRGEYRLLGLPPGTYKLTVTFAGFSQYMQMGLQLLVNTPATVNVQLKIGAMTENVTVTSEAPALNAVDASLGNSFGENQVKEVPIEARNVPELLSLQAGVTYTGHRLDLQDPSYKDQDTRSGAVNGAPQRSEQHHAGWR
ncbi:MAG TPA: carboxypeptidase-like regulatory domain-containing protein [Dongiaceae bacterium]|nr:carboxypeptidase-like regulatory domain-containing protein [Dongiaceae bacterium]